MQKNNIVVLIFVLLTFISCSSNDNHNYVGMDFRIFNGTPAEELASAVKWQNTKKIRHLVLEEGVSVDYQEPKYGNTVLMNAIMNGKYKSVETLLDLGADPNLYGDSIDQISENSVLIAASWPISPKFLKKLLEYGGNPNSICKGCQVMHSGKRVPWRASALDYAAAESIENVRLLVEYGADVNRSKDSCYVPSALKEALVLDNMEIALCLLEHGANYEGNFVCDGEYNFRGPRDILDELRWCTPPLWSKEFRYKKKVIEFLQKRGLDYYGSPISEAAIENIKSLYPLTWKGYIKVY